VVSKYKSKFESKHIVVVDFVTQAFVLSSNQYQAAKVSTTRIYAGRSGVQIWAGVIELSILQKNPDYLQCTPCLQINEIQSFSLAVMWPVQAVCPLISVWSQV